MSIYDAPLYNMYNKAIILFRFILRITLGLHVKCGIV